MSLVGDVCQGEYLRLCFKDSRLADNVCRREPVVMLRQCVASGQSESRIIPEGVLLGCRGEGFPDEVRHHLNLGIDQSAQNAGVSSNSNAG